MYRQILIVNIRRNVWYQKGEFIFQSRYLKGKDDSFWFFNRHLLHPPYHMWCRSVSYYLEVKWRILFASINSAVQEQSERSSVHSVKQNLTTILEGWKNVYMATTEMLASWGMLGDGEGGMQKKSYIRRSSAPRSKPLPIHLPLLTERVTVSYVSSIEKWHSSHKPAEVNFRLNNLKWINLLFDGSVQNILKSPEYPNDSFPYPFVFSNP